MISIKIRPSVLIRDDSKALLMRYQYGETEVWGIPGGSIDEGESMVDTIRREVREELDIDIDVDELLCVIETPAAGTIARTLHCVFAGRLRSGTPMVMPAQTSALGAEWVELSKLQNKILYPPINDVVAELAAGKTDCKYLGVRERTWY